MHVELTKFAPCDLAFAYHFFKYHLPCACVFYFVALRLELCASGWEIQSCVDIARGFDFNRFYLAGKQTFKMKSDSSVEYLYLFVLIVSNLIFIR